MKFSRTILFSIFTALTSKVVADCTYDSGNYYCNEVSAVVYNNVGYSGSYLDVTKMDENTCECSQSSKSFSGTNAPLDEELSVHFRGPLKLLQFGVYYPSSSSQKKREEEECSTTRTVHGHHVHKRATEIVEVTQTVFVDSNGNVVTQQEQDTTSTTSKAVVTASDVVAKENVQDNTTSSKSTAKTQTTLTASATKDSQSGFTSTSTAQPATTSSSSGSSTSSSSWTRKSYYKPGSADNVVFLNTKGGSNGSGTWSSCFGNSLSYCAANGVDSTSSATILNEVTFKSDEEFVIFSGESCSSSKSSQGTECGYYRSNIPAYHGFGGSQKIFVFEFEMPHDTSSSGASNPDMPAVWLLNAKIPRTLQYGKASCSCWGTGCGELDLFEILSKGSEKLISHIHSGQGKDGTSTGGGGSQDYFARPSSGSFKGAAIFNSDKSIHVVQLDSSFNFGSGLDSNTVNSWLSKTGGAATLS